MMIIKIEAEKNGQHLFQSQSHRVKNWLDGYIAVPPNLENDIYSCNGYCDLIIENGVLDDILPRPELIPKDEIETTPSANDLINALLGVTSYE